MVDDRIELNIESIAHLLCEASLDPLLICDQNTIIQCTDSVAKLFGYNSTLEVLSVSVKELLKRHFTPKFVNELNDTRPATLLDICFCHVIDHATRTSKVVTVKVKEWFFYNQKFYSVGIKDVSSFVNAPLAAELDEISELSRRQRRVEDFEWLADSLPCLIWVLTSGGDAEYVNKRVSEILGLDAGGNWEGSIHPEDWKRFAPKFRDSLKNPSTYTVELRYRHVMHSIKEKLEPNRNRDINGLPIIDETQYRWYLVNSVPVFNKEDGSMVRWVTTATDIHDHKLAEEEKQNLILKQQTAESVARMKSEFLAMMSHEIRTPLFGIVGNICILSETSVNPDQKSLLNQTSESARHLMSIIEDILDFQRIEAGKLNIEQIPIDIQDILFQLEKLFLPKAEIKGLKLEIYHLGTISPMIGDPNRLTQLLSNLLSNSIKFTHNGYVKMITKIIDIDPTSVMIEYAISDTGIGIGPNILPNIFSPWTQADTSNRRIFGGTGLGLAITKSLVELMSGKIKVETEVNRGTTIYVQIPFNKFIPSPSGSKQSLNLSKLIRNQTFRANMRLCLTLPNQTQRTCGTPKKSPNRSNSLRGSLKALRLKKPSLIRKHSNNNEINLKNLNGNSKPFKVLIAEDNMVNQAILKRYLQKMGDIDVVMVPDGLAALEAYHNNPKGYFHVILLDQSMPKMDGDDVCKEIRKTDTNQIIISVSANTLLADQAHFLSLGMNDHISKPVIYANFQSVLRKWLNAAVETANSSDSLDDLNNSIKEI